MKKYSKIEHMFLLKNKENNGRLGGK